MKPMLLLHSQTGNISLFSPQIKRPAVNQKGSRSPAKEQCLLNCDKNGILSQGQMTCRHMGQITNFFEVGEPSWRTSGKQAYAHETFQVILEHFCLQSNSPLLSLGTVTWQEEIKPGREVNDPAHRASPPDGGHGPSCSRATPLEGGEEVPVDWRSDATEKGKSTIQSIAEYGMSVKHYGQHRHCPMAANMTGPSREGMQISPEEIFTSKQVILTLFIVTTANGIQGMSELILKQ